MCKNGVIFSQTLSVTFQGGDVWTLAVHIKQSFGTSFESDIIS